MNYLFVTLRADIFEERYALAIENQEPDSFETYFGVELLENWYSVSVYPAAGGISVYFRITTERKRAEMEIQKSLDNFKQMFNGADLPMFLIEPETGNIEEANSAATQFYGYAKDQLRGMNIGEINPMPREEIRKNRDRPAQRR